MADQFYAEPWSEEPVTPTNDKRVAVIGAGPAGLTTALRLVQQGYPVTVFEKMPQPGGMMTYGIPAYRLPREPLFAEIDHIRHMGVDIRCNQELGQDFTIDSLQQDYDAVVLALGAHKSKKLRIPGEEKAGVYHGIDFLRDIALGQPRGLAGKRVVVVGGGDAAMDAARSAWRLDAAEVHVVYRREEKDMPALKEEIEEAKEEGIEFHFLATPVAALGDDEISGIRVQRQQLGKFDTSGRRRPEPIPGSEFDLSCDVLIPAIGQATDFDWLADERIETQWSSVFKVSDSFETTIPGVFAAGDAVSGPATVIEAVAQGNKVATVVQHWLETGELQKHMYRPPRHDIPQYFNVEDYADARRPYPRILSPTERLPDEDHFIEVEVGYDEETAREEARRCLRCDLEWLRYVGEPMPETR
jgi:NADPH-dependent glutamate synthase beta subunit-like oxidoreductase